MAQGRSKDEPEEIRRRLRASKRAIDETYIQMGRDLYLVYHRRLFVQWGHDTFDDFAENEMKISRKRAERVRLIWTHFIKECGLKPSELSGLGYTCANELRGATDSSNVKRRIKSAKDLSWRALRRKIAKWKEPPKDVTDDMPKATDDESADDTTPLTAADGRTALGFKLYPSQQKVVQAALDEVSRGKPNEMAPNEALANIATEFLASRMSKEEEPVTRCRYMLSTLERVYGGKIIWIPNDKAAEALAQYMEKHPDLFGEPTEELEDDE